MSLSLRHSLLSLVSIGVALAGTTWILSRALLLRGNQLADLAATSPEFVARMQARSQARLWYQRAAVLPLGAEIPRQALKLLDASAQPDLDMQRQTLEGGAQGAALHVQWLSILAEQAGWPGDWARLRQLRALVSYGKAEGSMDSDEPPLPSAAGPDAQGPFSDYWRGLAALWSGQIDRVPLSLQDKAPALVLLGKRSVDPGATARKSSTTLMSKAGRTLRTSGRRHQPLAGGGLPPPLRLRRTPAAVASRPQCTRHEALCGGRRLPDACTIKDVDLSPARSDESDLARLVRAERLRRSGETLRARRQLAALIYKDSAIAAAATQSYGLSLVDELTRKPDSMMLENAGAVLEPNAMAALKARLLLAPDDDPAWAGAWLALAEIDTLRGAREDCVAAAWAAVGLSSATWAPPPQQLPALARLDAAGLVNPSHVQRVRFAVDDARKAAAAMGQATTDLVNLETALLLIQGQASLAARDLPVARRRIDMAAAMNPSSSTVAGWSLLAALLDDDVPGALASINQATKNRGLQAVAKSWLKPEPVDRVDSPARALRSLLQKPWGPTQLMEFAKTHADHPDDLDLALRSPPSDHIGLAQALAQTYLWLRVSRALGVDTAPASTALNRLRKAAMDEPLWAFFALGAYSLDGPGLPPDR